MLLTIQSAASAQSGFFADGDRPVPDEVRKAQDIQNNCTFFGEGRGDDREQRIENAEAELKMLMLMEQQKLGQYEIYEYTDNVTNEKVTLLYVGYHSDDYVTVKPPDHPSTSHISNTTTSKPVEMTSTEQNLVDDIARLSNYSDVKSYCIQRQCNQQDITTGWISDKNDAKGCLYIVFNKQQNLIALLDKSGEFDILQQKQASLEKYMSDKSQYAIYYIKIF